MERFLEQVGVDRLPGLEPDFKGKVREIFDLGERLLVVATDRVSAYDRVLPTLIPGRGKILTSLSIFWFRFLEGTIRHHFVTEELQELPPRFSPYLETLRGRSMLVKKAERIDVECVVRGYLAGSGWKEYSSAGTVCGLKLPAGLKRSEKLSEPIFTPATKSTTSHDENISFATLVDLVGAELADLLRQKSIQIYSRAADYAFRRGVIVADTKFEFGFVDGELTLIDEVLSPDSSRFWPVEEYAVDRDPPSFDKQIIRNFLDECGWDRTSSPPELPPEVVRRTQLRYLEALKRLEAEGN